MSFANNFSHSRVCLVVLICISLIIDGEHLFSSVGHLYVVFGEISVHVFFSFLKWIICFLSFVSSLYILDTNPLSDMSLAKIFSHSIGCLLVLLIVSFSVQKLFILMKFIFAFVSLALGDVSSKKVVMAEVRGVSAYVFF